MNMKTIKPPLSLGILAVLSLTFFTQCSSKKTYSTTVTSYAADNLDLKAVTALATEVETAEELEKKLNDPATKINNLDLDEDDKVDYIKVTEIAGEQKGFSLTVEVPSETGVEEQEIATIQFDLTKDKQRVQTHGNRYIYGAGYYYYGRPRYSIFPIGGYFSRDHRPHRSSYGRNNKPSNFTSSKPMATKDYTSQQKTRAVSKGYGSSINLNKTSSMASGIKSPNANKVASRIKAPLKSPSSSQKSYQKSSPSKYSKRVPSSSASSSSSKTRFGSSSSSRSGSSFGGGK
ncbi:MAG: hypothetical protein ACI9E1_002270 [Cryomorphaceae bacterium]|jgi:uncharacterized protein YneR